MNAPNNASLKQSPHSIHGFVHLMAFGMLANWRGFLTVKDIEHATGWSLATVYRLLNEAEDAGFVYAYRAHKPHKYTITNTAIAEMEQLWKLAKFSKP